MNRRLGFALLALVLAPGCATTSTTASRQSARRTVTLEVKGGETVTYTPESGGQPVPIPETELWPAFVAESLGSLDLLANPGAVQ